MNHQPRAVNTQSPRTTSQEITSLSMELQNIEVNGIRHTDTKSERRWVIDEIETLTPTATKLDATGEPIADGEYQQRFF